MFKGNSDNEQEQKSRALNERGEFKTTKLRQFDISIVVASHVFACRIARVTNELVMHQAAAGSTSMRFPFRRDLYTLATRNL